MCLLCDSLQKNYIRICKQSVESQKVYLVIVLGTPSALVCLEFELAFIKNFHYIFFRLVDIHKQALPAKDTGLLKKRCITMGLPIKLCSEMQRDFLIRYARAAASKSTVVVSKDVAEQLIGFYVNPPPKAHHRKDDTHTDVKVCRSIQSRGKC